MSSAQRPTSLLAPATVYERTTLSRTTVWRMVRLGEFPAPVRVSRNRIAWFEADIEAWLKRWFTHVQPPRS